MGTDLLEKREWTTEHKAFTKKNRHDQNFSYDMENLNAVKCNLTEVTTKSISILWKSAVFCKCACVIILCALYLRCSWGCFEHELAVSWGVVVHRPGSFSYPFPPSFHHLFTMTNACFPFLGHGWVARICQPSKSWLPIVEAPGCFRHLTST